jgi:hypothetical protein
MKYFNVLLLTATFYMNASFAANKNDVDALEQSISGMSVSHSSDANFKNAELELASREDEAGFRILLGNISFAESKLDTAIAQYTEESALP